MSITVFDQNCQTVRRFWNDDSFELFYHFDTVIRRMEKENRQYFFFQGGFHELFLMYHYDDSYILLGPWRSNVFDQTFFQVAVSEKDLSQDEQTMLYQALKKLPVYPLNTIRDLLLVTHYLFSGKVEDLLSSPLHRFVNDFLEGLEAKKTEVFGKTLDTKISLYNYEHLLTNLAQEGDVDKLKELVFSVRNSFVPDISGDTLRSEKNYSIIAFDRLSQIAISCGMDIVEAYSSREEFMKTSELATSLPKVLEIRDASLVFYTQKIGDIRNRHLKHASPTVNAIIQYININLHKNLLTPEIAEHFHMSESKLRQVFKRGTDLTIYQYTSNMKIQKAKALLRAAYSIHEISDILGFADPSHFSKFFKKNTGENPKSYQNRQHD
ncbi:YSIRK-targeted surface antigen transcriptional regulator [Streptococcus castoreus]|uniref:YSIRK-targeted surface antigen transcriptional regulator n=1 Tax=Streptococcus castoreus TaxID=254786 RepID=UPI003CC52BB4